MKLGTPLMLFIRCLGGNTISKHRMVFLSPQATADLKFTLFHKFQKDRELCSSFPSNYQLQFCIPQSPQVPRGFPLGGER